METREEKRERLSRPLYIASLTLQMIRSLHPQQLTLDKHGELAFPKNAVQNRIAQNRDETHDHRRKKEEEGR